MPGFSHALDLPWNLRVEEDERMQVPITRVKDIAHAQPVAVTDFADTPQNVRKARAWYHSVLHVELRANASNRPKSVFATSPEQLAFGLVRRDAHNPGMMFVAYANNLLYLGCHAFM